MITLRIRSWSKTALAVLQPIAKAIGLLSFRCEMEYKPRFVLRSALGEKS
jgi:hypothetical protein